MTKTVTIEFSEPALAEIERAQAATGEGLAEFVAVAARERAGALTSNSFFARREKPFDLEAFLAVLNREGGEPPPPDDRAGE